MPFGNGCSLGGGFALEATWDGFWRGLARDLVWDYGLGLVGRSLIGVDLQ